jgi:hypothetical protein
MPKSGHKMDGPLESLDMARRKKQYTPKAIVRFEKMRHAVELRAKGWSQQAIADEMDVNVKTVRAWIRDALQDTLMESTEELRALQMERFNALFLHAYAKAEDATDRDQIQAINAAASLLRDMNKMAGVNVEGTGPSTVINETTNNVEVGGVLVIEGDKDSYEAGLRAMIAGKGELPPGEDPNIVDAELVEEDDYVH